MPRQMKAAIAALSAITAMIVPGQAQAFDTYAHADLTSNAMTAEGFNGDAVSVGQVFNWFPDLYHFVSASKLPASGEAGLLEQLVIASGLRSENWPDSVIDAATRSHFYGVREAPEEAQMPSLGTTAGITAEWERLQRAVGTLVREAHAENNPEKLVEVLGMSLHQVQDFYAHTNWVEPRAFHEIPGADGPGWAERGFGSNPTWFDIPASVRDQFRIYGAETANGSGTVERRVHGAWNADNNASLMTAMAKDWPGRPLHQQAVMSAYFASRQWLEAVHSWVNDDAFWERAQNYHPISNEERCELGHDLWGMHEIMFYAGQWQGGGEPYGGYAEGPGGNLLDLRGRVLGYFSPFCQAAQRRPPSDRRRPPSDERDPGVTNPRGSGRTKTHYRAQFERLILGMADPNASGPVGPVLSSAALQRQTRFVALRIHKLKAEGLGDPGPDDADMYANVRINDNLSSSSEVHSHDSFVFHRPLAPFSWFEAVPASSNEQEPVESVEVEVKTANVRWAGTNDDVFLRLGPGMKLPLQKRFYDDFERGDRDTYSVPIDDLVAPGLRVDETSKIALAPIGEAGRRSMRVGDITEVGIEKSSDGIAGGWKLGGIRVWVNGEQVYDNQGINRWLEDDHRRWIAPDFESRDPRGAKVPVSIFLADDDSNLYGDDDEGDINGDDHRRVFSIGYTLGDQFQRTARGGGRLGGRVGFEHGDKASIVYSLETITPEPPPVGSVTLPREEIAHPLPDLILTAASPLGVTVKNQGNGASGAFRVMASDGDQQSTVTFSGLPAGASETRGLLGIPCEGEGTATVDDLHQVIESDELNNERALDPVIC